MKRKYESSSERYSAYAWHCKVGLWLCAILFGFGLISRNSDWLSLTLLAGVGGALVLRHKKFLRLADECLAGGRDPTASASRASGLRNDEGP